MTCTLPFGLCGVRAKYKLILKLVEVNKIMNVKIEQSWKNALSAEFDKDYFIKLTDFVRGEYLSGKTVYPEPQNIFNAFNLCP